MAAILAKFLDSHLEGEFGPGPTHDGELAAPSRTPGKGLIIMELRTAVVYDLLGDDGAVDLSARAEGDPMGWRIHGEVVSACGEPPAGCICSTAKDHHIGGKSARIDHGTAVDVEFLVDVDVHMPPARDAQGRSSADSHVMKIIGPWGGQREGGAPGELENTGRGVV